MKQNKHETIIQSYMLINVIRKNKPVQGMEGKVKSTAIVGLSERRFTERILT